MRMAMRQPVSKSQLRGYLAARSRAIRFIRDSSPPLTNKGLAIFLDLEPSAFNKFMNGTILVNADGQTISLPEAKDAETVYLRSKWTINRLARFIQLVETGCWKMGLSHKPAVLRSAARNEAERIRLSKYFQQMCAIKDSDIGIASGIALWNAFAQEAYDAREHLRPTMCVNALMTLGDLVDRKEDGKYSTLSFSGKEQLQRLEFTANSVAELTYCVHELTGDPCLEAVETKFYECHHKAHGYGGYDKYFLGLALKSDQLQLDGVEHLFHAVVAEQNPNDGHVANTATVVESALALGNAKATSWAHDFRSFVEESLLFASGVDRCKRLGNMRIPNLRERWGDDFFRLIANASMGVYFAFCGLFVGHVASFQPPADQSARYTEVGSSADAKMLADATCQAEASLSDCEGVRFEHPTNKWRDQV